MPNSQIAIFSDLHLGVHMNSQVWHDVSLNWAKWITEELKSKNIKEIIFCGDFFHSRSEITVNTLHHASTILEYFKDFKLYMLAGNHDSFYKNNCTVNSIRIFYGRDNIIIVDRPTLLQIGGKECFFAPWGTELSEIQDCDIVFGHFEIETFKMNTFKVCEGGFKSQDLLKFAPLVISGHFHLREERKYSNGTVLYVGCPFELDFGDEGSTKGYYILDMNKASYDFYPNDISPRHIKINLSDLIKIENFTEAGRTVLGNNIIKLGLDKNISAQDLEKLTIKLHNFKPLNLVVDNSIEFDKFGADLESNIDLSGVDIAKAITDFVQMLDIDNKKDVVEYTVSLYNQCK
jgi:DNA repair exonuclease SbcCD nuclease subunit